MRNTELTVVLQSDLPSLSGFLNLSKLCQTLLKTLHFFNLFLKFGAVNF